ncbi:MAG: EAL domain-containing protein [Acidobacteria bacterium]|nr:EAL domain-containing protein [Acidobacteriota bacterium]MCG3193584.1 Cyclic di-GMP phosphodiesterase PdeB [Thermoanaerobaculia bacterium]
MADEGDEIEDHGHGEATFPGIQPPGRESLLPSQLAKILASAFTQAQSAIVLTDATERIIAVNPAFVDLTGYEEKEALGRRAGFLQGAQTDPMTRDRIRQALDQRDPIRVEILNYKKDGRTFWAEISIEPVFDYTGTLTHWISFQRDISRRREGEQQRIELLRQVTQIAETDSLTHLPNRDWFLAQLERAINLSTAKSRQLTLILADLDRFREINETSGYATGDQTLVMVGQLFRENLRKPDMVARLGGDEFGILLPETSVDNAPAVARKLLSALGAQGLTVADGLKLRMTASFGVASLPQHGHSARELLAAADAALHDAKERGRNQWRVAEIRPGETTRMAGLWRRREEILEGLDSGAFVPYFQPVLNLTSGRLEKNEALARWVSPAGVRFPSEFLPAADHFGLSPRLDLVVLKASLERIQSLRRAGKSWGAVAVNLSAQSLDDDSLPARILEMLEATGNSASDLILEITETVAIRSTERTRAFIEKLREKGIRFALDDFGVGYSAFSHLRTLPLDYLKFDISFVRNLTNSEFDQVFVRGMNEMAHGLGLKTIAEGVETFDVLTLLAEMKVDYAQGYLIGRPAPSLAFGMSADSGGIRMGTPELGFKRRRPSP